MKSGVFRQFFSGRNLPVDTLERLEVNREMLALGFIAQSQVRDPGPATNQQNWVLGERIAVDSTRFLLDSWSFLIRGKTWFQSQFYAIQASILSMVISCLSMVAMVAWFLFHHRIPVEILNRHTSKSSAPWIWEFQVVGIESAPFDMDSFQK